LKWAWLTGQIGSGFAQGTKGSPKRAKLVEAASIAAMGVEQREQLVKCSKSQEL